MGSLDLFVVIPFYGFFCWIYLEQCVFLEYQIYGMLVFFLNDLCVSLSGA